ncbi:hypothetical protein HA402_014132 [Bradysia odoriphaga]|nr:hypothetical protein HA402_014132 [Bradysia odoriphaga]
MDQSFIKEVCEMNKMRSRLRSTSEHEQTEENRSEEHKSAETQSSSVEIKVTVEQEVKMETEPDGNPNNPTAKSEEKGPDCSENPKRCKTSANLNEDMWSDDDDSNHVSPSLVSTLREKLDDRTENSNRSVRQHSPIRYVVSSNDVVENKVVENQSYRSRSPARRRRSKDRADARRSQSRDRRRRDYSNDKEAGRRSRSRDRHRRDYSTDKEAGRRSRSRDRRRRHYSTDKEAGKRSRSRDRRRRDYSTDREARSKSRSRSRGRRSVTPYRRTRHRIENRRSRSRSTSRRNYSSDRESGRRSKNSDRHRRDYSNYIKGGKRSKSRKRRRRDNSTDRDGERSTRSRSRGRRDYSTDRDTRKKSRSGNRRQRSVTPYQRAPYREDKGRSRDRSENDAHRSERNLNQSRNDGNRREDQPHGSPGCLRESPNGTDKEGEQKFSCSRTTIEILRSRIQSTLKNAASSTMTSEKISQKVQSNSFEEYRSETSETANTESNGNGACSEESMSRVEVKIDETIFNKIVLTATSSASKHSNVKIDIAPADELNDSMQFNRMDPRTKNAQGPQTEEAQSAKALFDSIKDPRIRKMIQTPYQQQPHQQLSYQQSPHQQVPHKQVPQQHLPHQQLPHQPLYQHQHPYQMQSLQHQPLQHQPLHHQPFQHQPFQQHPYEMQPFQHQPYRHENQTSESENMLAKWGGSRGPNKKKSVAITYGEYKKQQLRKSSSGTNDKAKIGTKLVSTPTVKSSESISTPKTKALEVIATPKSEIPQVISTPEANVPELISSPEAKASELAQSPDVTRNTEKIVTLKKATEKEPLVHEQSSNKITESGRLHEQSKIILKSKGTKARGKKTTVKHAVTHKKRKTKKMVKSVKSDKQLKKLSKPEDAKIQEKAMEKQAAVHEKGEDNRKKLEHAVNATANDGSSSSSQAFSALKEIVNPQQLLTLLDIMKQMTENNSLAEVKEALKICTSDEDTTAVGKLDSTTESTGNQTKIKKNELDRLHEDIDNMFIRDGVLNANGRRRTGSRADTKSSMTDSVAVEGKRKIEKKRGTASDKAVVNSKNQRPLISDDIKGIPCTGGDGPVVLLTRLIPMKHPRAKNNNLEWHSLKTVLPCQICYDPPGISLISHYVNFHPDAEVLNSRLAPEAAQCLRSATDFPQCEVARSDTTLLYKEFCYFCNANCAYSKQGWISHLIRHTGYYDYKCNGCLRKFSSRAQHHGCGVPNSAIEKIDQPIFQQPNITAYVCELCNYVRFFEGEMKMHLNNEHEDDERKDFKKLAFFTLPPAAKVGRPRKV